MSSSAPTSPSSGQAPVDNSQQNLVATQFNVIIDTLRDVVTQLAELNIKAKTLEQRVDVLENYNKQQQTTTTPETSSVVSGSAQVHPMSPTELKIASSNASNAPNNNPSGSALSVSSLSNISKANRPSPPAPGGKVDLPSCSSSSEDSVSSSNSSSKLSSFED